MENNVTTDQEFDFEKFLEGKTNEQKEIILKAKYDLLYYRDVFIYCCGLSEEEAIEEIMRSCRYALKCQK